MEILVKNESINKSNNENNKRTNLNRQAKRVRLYQVKLQPRMMGNGDSHNRIAEET